MSRLTREGRADQIAFDVIARTLDRRIVLRTTDRGIFHALQYLACTPEIGGGAAATVAISIEQYREWHRIVEHGVPDKEVFDAKGAVDHLHGRVFAIGIGDRPGAALLHAASLRRRGRRVLLVGGKGVGKTTLTLRLVRAGYEIEGDEHVFVGPGGVIARPRACRVKDTALPLLADMADVIRAAPSYEFEHGRRIFNVDPRLVGGEWRIDQGPVDHVIILQSNHGGYSSMRPIGPLMLAQALMAELAATDSGRGAAVAAVAALANRARGFDLSLGDLERAIWFIDRLTDG